jgi:cbb3-type cytochrome oxidase subunit 3
VLRDIMSAAGLSFFAQVSLVLFVLVFVALAFYLFATRGSPQWEKARYLPLDDDHPQQDRPVDSRDGGGS